MLKSSKKNMYTFLIKKQKQKQKQMSVNIFWKNNCKDLGVGKDF
jgi:hypothetical protein